MEVIYQSQKIENLTKSIIKKYDLDEKILINSLNKKDKNFCGVFQKLIEKSELNNSSNSLDEANNNIKQESTLKKEEIEIEKYIIKNYDNYKESLKKNNINLNIEKNSKMKFDNLAPTTPPTDKKIFISDKKELNRIPSFDKSKRSLFINKYKKFNFFSCSPKNQRHQSLIAVIPQLSKTNSNKSFRSSNSNNSKKNMKPRIKKSKFYTSNMNNKARKSLFLKIDKNSNLEYNSKKIFQPLKNRKSVVQQNNFKFKFLNNSNSDIKLIANSQKREKAKSKFNKNESKKNENEAIKRVVLYTEENYLNGIKKKETYISDNKISEKNGKSIIYNIEEKESIEKNKNDSCNFNNSTNMNKDKSKKNEENKINMQIYKNKYSLKKIYKKKKIKSLSQPKSKKYLNNKICHQISITLKETISNNLKCENNINNSASKISKSSPKNNRIKDIKLKEKIEIKNKQNITYNNEEDKEEEKISNNKNIYKAEKNIRCNKKKLKLVSFKINDKIINRNAPSNDLEDCYYTSDKNIKFNNDFNHDDEAYQPKTSLVSKKADIKNYKMNNNYIPKNINIKCDRLIKEFEKKN